MQPTVRKTLNTKPPNAKNLNLAIYYKVTARENNLVPNKTLLTILQDIDSINAIDLKFDVAGPLNIELFLITIEYARRSFPEVRKIDFSGNSVTNDTVKQLIEVIRQFPSLRSINLSMGNFGAPGARLLTSLRKTGLEITCADCRAVRGYEKLLMKQAGIVGV